MKNRLFSLILAVCVTCSFALALSASAVVDGTPATDSVTADNFYYLQHIHLGKAHLYWRYGT